MARKQVQKGKQKERKNIPVGVAHIHSSFNNTLVTITDPQGKIRIERTALGDDAGILGAALLAREQLLSS